MRRLAVLLALAVAARRADAARATTSAVFDEGVAAYEAQRYADAEGDFRKLLGEGVIHPTVLFNLGDAAYRQGKWAVAVYAFEWALELNPADVEAEDNLALARSKLVTDEVPPTVSPSMARGLDALGRVPPLATGILFLVLWTAGWLLIALRIARGSATASAGVALILLSLVFGAHVAYEVATLRGPPRGVLQAAEVEVKSGPGASYETLFTLHAGTVVQQMEVRGTWCRIAIPHGPSGWIATDALAVLGRPETLPAQA